MRRKTKYYYIIIVNNIIILFFLTWPKIIISSRQRIFVYNHDLNIPHAVGMAVLCRGSPNARKEDFAIT